MALQKIPDRTFINPRGRIAVIVSEFNPEITEELLKGAEALFDQYEGIEWQVHRVPGAFEIPLMAQKLSLLVQVTEEEKEIRIFDCIVALGCVIKGETKHFDLIAENCARGCMDVMLVENIPIVFEVLACSTKQDAVKRSTGENNHGKLAAMTALSWLEKFE